MSEQAPKAEKTKTNVASKDEADFWDRCFFIQPSMKEPEQAAERASRALELRRKALKGA